MIIHPPNHKRNFQPGDDWSRSMDHKYFKTSKAEKEVHECKIDSITLLSN